jgi:hypothetical protein
MTEYERFGLVFTKTRVYKFGHRVHSAVQNFKEQPQVHLRVDLRFCQWLICLNFELDGLTSSLFPYHVYQYA